MRCPCGGGGISLRRWWPCAAVAVALQRWPFQAAAGGEAAGWALGSTVCPLCWGLQQALLHERGGPVGAAAARHAGVALACFGWVKLVNCVSSQGVRVGHLACPAGFMCRRLCLAHARGAAGLAFAWQAVHQTHDGCCHSPQTNKKRQCAVCIQVARQLRMMACIKCVVQTAWHAG